MPLAAQAIGRQVRRDTKQVVAAMGVGVERRVGAQKPVVGVLQQVVGRGAIAGEPEKVRPQLTRRAVVEAAELILVHPERHVGFGAGKNAEGEFWNGRIARCHDGWLVPGTRPDAPARSRVLSSRPKR
jgi:hypothetical protein